MLRRKRAKKKASPKRTKKSKRTKIVFIDAPDNALFWVADGAVLKNLHELAFALEGMSEETYHHHVNSGKNDFSNWVSQILNEHKTAASLKKTKSRKGALRVVKNRIRGK